MRQPTDPVVVVEKPGAAEPLEQIENFLPLAKAMEKRRERADVQAVGADGEKVRCDPLKLGGDDADGLDALVELDAHQLFDRRGVGEAVVHRAHVIQAVGERNDALVVDVLRVLFEVPMQVADVRSSVFDDLSVGLELDAQHAVGRRVLRPHVEDHLAFFEILGLEKVCLVRLQVLVLGLGAHGYCLVSALSRTVLHRGSRPAAHVPKTSRGV